MPRKNKFTPESYPFHSPTVETGAIISRRTALKFISILGATAAVPELTRVAGEMIDTQLSHETLLTPHAMVPLEPRETDTPIVEFQLHSKPMDVPTRFTRHDDTTTLHFDGDIPLRAEHTGTLIEDTEFTAAGTAIITTAEGLKNGEQAYCQLFTSETSTVAVGYEGGLYVYEPGLGSKESQGEWVRIVTTSDKDVRSSHVMSTASWEDLESAKPDTLLIEDVTDGTETLRTLGYRPFGAILESTRMPKEKDVTFEPEKFAQTPEEITSGTKQYFLTDDGIVIDLRHLEGKAKETLGLFAQLLTQQISGETHPTAGVKYSGGSESKFTFAVEAASLSPDTITDATFAVMNAVSNLMEGISQQFALKNAPFLDTLTGSSGMSHEDMFTNTLGISGMLALIKERRLAEKLSQDIRALRRHYPTMSAEDISNIVVEKIKQHLVMLVLEQTAQTHGIRSFEEPITATLPRGIYSVIPVKVDSENAKSPRRITPLLRAAGINTNNPNVRITPTHVPAYESTMEHVWKRAGL